MKKRIEKDFLGEVSIPEDKYYGAQTQRALVNFAIGRERMPIEMIHAMAQVKKCAALANCNLGILSQEKALLISDVCEVILNGDLDDHFPVNIFQSGSGTQTNMNINEVIANVAKKKCGGQPLHPHDDVNLSQSTNDVFPAAMHLSSTLLIKHKLMPALIHLQKALEEKGALYKDLVKVGRTHLMDAVPMTLGQEFFAFAALIHSCIERLEEALEGLSELPLGGTAVGTGLNAPEKFGMEAIKILSEKTGISFALSPNLFAAISMDLPIAILSSALRLLSLSFNKIASDLILLSSGPHAGIGELYLPANEIGSSIMPGKVNPSQCEALKMVAAQVIGSDHTVFAAISQSNLQLNANRPIIIYNILRSIHLLSDGARSFADNCLAGIKPNIDNIKKHLDDSLMIATALVKKIGYDKAAQIVRKAHKEKIPLKRAAMEMGLTESEFVSLCDLDKLV